MSKFNNLNPYRLGSDERVVELNGPEIAELYVWYNQVKKLDSLTAQESQSVMETLERGPLFEHHEGLMVTLKQIKHVESWVKIVQPQSELTKSITEAFAAAKEGKRRPDLLAKEEELKKAQAEANKESEKK